MSEAAESPGGLDEALAEELRALVERARELGQADRLAALAEELCGASAVEISRAGAEGRFGMIGASDAMLEVYDLIERVAPSDVPVLVQGETGTGKELVARALHEHGRRKGARLMAENCAAVPENLLESELFGHKKGAFTGRPRTETATSWRRTVARSSSTRSGTCRSRCRRSSCACCRTASPARGVERISPRRRAIVAATHRDLVEAARDGSFREDLLFRLNVITIHLPPSASAPATSSASSGAAPGIAEEVGARPGSRRALALSPRGPGRGTSGNSRTNSGERWRSPTASSTCGPVPADRRGERRAEPDRPCSARRGRLERPRAFRAAAADSRSTPHPAPVPMCGMAILILTEGGTPAASTCARASSRSAAELT